ncbi:hypothetical protein AQ711_23145 [Burkholderia pseudomallei]|nr:hypothetical protein AQ711_23145 [Burkholderia pseudomallei]
MPFMSRPDGGMPPAAIGVRVSGGKPSTSDAPPGFVPICDASGMVLKAPPAAKANGTSVGV